MKWTKYTQKLFRYKNQWKKSIKTETSTKIKSRTEIIIKYAHKMLVAIS